MKKLVFLTVCFVAFVANSNAQSNYKGEKGISSIGVIMGHAIDSKAFTVGADYRYNVLDRVRLAPSVLYTFENDYTNTLYFNADAHYLARITKKVTIYPIGGIGVSVWKYDGIINGLEDLFDIDDSHTKVSIGLNLGFGGEIRLTPDILVGAEFRYNLTSERFYDQAMLLARAAYYF
jgi:opacity protein-like surface antigen